MSETHKRFFRGCWVRPELFPLLEEGVVTCKEVVLLSVIDSMVENSGQDCFASNAYLANILQVKENRASVMIRKLEGLGLLIRTKSDGRRRFLRTAWSRIAVKIDEECSSSRISQPHPQGLAYSTKTNKTNNIACEASASKQSEWEIIAKEFYEATSIKRNPTPSFKKWGNLLKRFANANSIPFKRMRAVLSWYSSQFDKENQPYYRKYLPEYIPQAITARGFIGKFWEIETSMLRIKEESKKTEPIRLTKFEQKRRKEMSHEIGHAATDFDTLPPLVRSIRQFRQKVVKLLRKEVTEKDCCFYKDNLLTGFNLFPGYAMWIDWQSSSWSDWGGDLMVFAPGGKNFKRYLHLVMRRENIGPDDIIRRIMDEASKG